MNTLEIRNLTKNFGGTNALNNVSFGVQQGKISGLIGRNGAGKTTTIRLILGIYAMEKGEILYEGTRIGLNFSDRVGYLPEERGLYQNMSIIDSVLFYGQLKGKSVDEIRPIALEYLEKFELADRLNSKVKDLSKGNQQKIQFICTVAHDPDLVILDEPFSGLDPVNLSIFKDMVLGLKARGKTVVLCTHVMDMAEKMCDHIVMLNKGQAILNDSLAAIKAQHSGSTLTLTYDGDISFLTTVPYVKSILDFGKSTDIVLQGTDRAQQVLKMLVENGVEVKSFKTNDVSLHNIFVALTGKKSGKDGVFIEVEDDELESEENEV